MKTWTNPTVEELEVKMTAEGWYETEIEQLSDLGANTNVDLWLFKKRQQS